MKNNIYIYKEALPMSSCDQIVDFLNKYKESTIKTKYSEGENVLCNKISFHSTDIIPDNKTSEIKELIALLFTNFVKKHVYSDMYQIRRCAFEMFQLREMYGPTKQHSDNVGPILNNNEINYRVLTIIATLSESTDTIHFPNQSCSYKLEKGTIITFPPYWNYPHYTESSIPGRVSIQSWLREYGPVSYNEEVIPLVE
jgi:hypothetical protein